MKQGPPYLYPPLYLLQAQPSPPQVSHGKFEKAIRSPLPQPRTTDAAWHHPSRRLIFLFPNLNLRPLPSPIPIPSPPPRLFSFPFPFPFPTPQTTPSSLPSNHPGHQNPQLHPSSIHRHPHPPQTPSPAMDPEAASAENQPMSGMSGDGADARCRRSVDMEALVWDLGGGGGGRDTMAFKARTVRGHRLPEGKTFLQASRCRHAHAYAYATLDTTLRNSMPHVSKRIVALSKKFDRCQNSYTEPLFRETGLSLVKIVRCTDRVDVSRLKE